MFRNNSIPILNKFYNNFPSPNSIEKKISEWLYLTKKFINDHPDILITNTDKSNVTFYSQKEHLYIENGDSF